MGKDARVQMTQTNLRRNIVRFNNIDPLITIELSRDSYSAARDIADKLGDIAKAKGEKTTTYSVQTIEIPSLDKKVYDDEIPF